MKNKFALFIATGFGSGYIPKAPGTMGSLVGVLIVVALIYLNNTIPLQTSLIIAALISAVAGIWASFEAESILKEHDPQKVVIDEVCGQIITYILIAPYMMNSQFPVISWLLFGFILFRLFDIWKPYPINRLQNLKGGWGVMVDDIGAGIYGAVVMFATHKLL